jgi:demethylmenaquinone methyltransferase/2-methoxy-6-polyprenyl-1,4-benzoquinol methylase
LRRRDSLPVLLLNPRPTAEASRLPEGAAKAQAVRAMFDTIAPRYDLVNRIMTFGLDRRWRRTAVASLHLEPRSRVLDVACGTGDLCRDLLAAGYQPVGVDMSMGMLSHSRVDVAMIQTDALELPLSPTSFDGAVSGFALRNFVALGPVFAELGRVIRPGGRVALLDVSAPSNPILRAGHSAYFGHVVPRIGAAFSDRDAYRYLPKSVAYLPSGDQMLDQLRQAGFESVDRRLLSGGVTQLITGTRSGAVP